MILITGADGQVGRSLKDTQDPELTVLYANRNELDITNFKQVENYIKNKGISGLINVAAYNAVDKAETDKDMARLVNSTGVENLSCSAAQFNFPIVHVSTDYVFDGKKTSPYEPHDATLPLSAYGDSKLKGEMKIQESESEWTIIRTSWVYSHHCSNFVKTMLRFMSEKESMQLVDDQYSSPTWAQSLAEFVWAALLQPPQKKILHWTDAGVVTPYEYAQAIQFEALDIGLLNKKIPLMPIHLADYKTAARRPKYSALATTETLKVKRHSWQENLKVVLKKLKELEK